MSCRPTRANAASARPVLAATRRAGVMLITVVSLLPLTLAACSHADEGLPTSSGGPVAETLPPPNAKRWSDPANWPEGKVPTAGANVVIGKGTDLLLDVSPP